MDMHAICIWASEEDMILNADILESIVSVQLEAQCRYTLLTIDF